MKVNTVNGPIEASELGTTLVHEHICCADWSMRRNFGANFFDYNEVIDAACAMLDKMSHACGIKTFVDGTPINLGRDVRLISEVAKRTGLNVIVSSGFYYQEELGLAYRPEDEIYELLLEECQNGVAGTGIMPGIMKAAVDKDGLTPYLVKILSAVARVATETGLPVFCHHNVANRNGGDIIDIFEGAGVDPSRFILGHSGDTDDLDYLLAMLERGCYIGMDRFGYCALGVSLERRVATIAALCERGFCDRMLLSHDLVAFSGFFGDMGTYKEMAQNSSFPDFTFIHTTVLPALLEAGVTQAQIDNMLEGNPRRFFAGE